MPVEWEFDIRGKQYKRDRMLAFKIVSKDSHFALVISRIKSSTGSMGFYQFFLLDDRLEVGVAGKSLSYEARSLYGCNR